MNVFALNRPSVITAAAAGVGTTAMLYLLYRRWLNDIRVPETFSESDELREVLKIIKKIKLIVSSSNIIVVFVIRYSEI